MYNIDKIKEQFNRVIEYSQGFWPGYTDELFDLWFKNKQYFIDKFGGKLIVDCGEISFTMDKNEKNYKISEFLDYLDFEYHLYDLTSFIDLQRESFYNNETCKEYEYHGTKIPAGAKLVKAFKHFIPNKELLTEIQNRASMIIQDDKIHGHLCFSVHPLDYLSVSETTYKWRSCHALDGEYRAGNLSYMADPTTVVCYLKGENDAVLPRFPSDVKWNSKKWRCLIFFSQSRKEIFFGRQYPMFAEEANDYMLVNLRRKNIIQNSPWTTPKNENVQRVGDQSLDHIYYPVEGKLYPLDKMVVDNSDLHFNDLLKSSFYTPYMSYTYEDFWNQKTMPYFPVGYEIPCLCCGRGSIDPQDNGSMMCLDCNPEEWDGDTYWCEYCGNSYHEEEMYFVEGMTICEDCMPEKTAPCAACGIVHLRTSSFLNEVGERFCSNRCMAGNYMKIEYKPYNREENNNGEGNSSQVSDRGETEGVLWAGLPW
jgi:hypothetical protein